MKVTKQIKFDEKSLSRKKRFELNYFFQQNTSKFAICMEKERNPRNFFRFFATKT